MMLYVGAIPDTIYGWQETMKRVPGAVERYYLQNK